MCFVAVRHGPPSVSGAGRTFVKLVTITVPRPAHAILTRRRAAARGEVTVPRHGGLLEKYAASVQGAERGAVTHSGGVDTTGDLD